MNDKRSVRGWGGVDGCRKGWVLALLTSSGIVSLRVFGTFGEVVQSSTSTRLILVDIPIGLPSREHPKDRTCDLIARGLLKGRESTVFPVPCREAVYSENYDQACERNSSVLHKKLSLASWGICKKIREVDEFFQKRASLQNRIRETHPELCFRLLNEETVSSKKRRSKGKRDREELIEPHVKNLPKCVSEIESEYLRKDVGRDDLLDAIAGAIVARLVCEGKAQSIPNQPEFDASGIRIEMLGGTP